MESKQRIAIITGAARGIGKAIAHELAIQKKTVFITDISEAGEMTADGMRAEGLQVFFKQVDVSDFEKVKSIVSMVEQEFGRIDILVNNAGIRPTKTFGQMELQDWQNVLRVNLDSVFNFCSSVLPIMQSNQWGRIINISSLAAQQGSTGGHSHYAASKAGMIGFAKSLAREYAKYGITVNSIAPGWIDTEGWGGALDGKREEYAEKVPAGRLGLPEDVAYATAFLASEEAGYITGITLPVNGGLYIN